MAFRAGQQVVCVDATHTNSVGRPELAERSVYTVRWVGIHENHIQTAALCVRLEEVQRINVLGEPDDMPFRASRFRPVKETDISIFTAMLAPTPKQRVRIDG